MENEYYRDRDERFYKDTAYNEEYYIEEERNLIRESDLELDYEFEDAGEILHQRAKGEMPGSLHIDYPLDVF